VNRYAWRPLLERWSQEILASDAAYRQSLPEELTLSRIHPGDSQATLAATGHVGA
jgi:hypothetical protein